MQDRQIVQMYLDRNEQAIAETKNAYGNYLLTIAFNILGNHEDAEEAEADTYVRTWNAIPPQIPLKLKVFLAKITRNISIDMYRKQHAERRGGQGCDMLLSELEEALPTLGEGVDDATPDTALDQSEVTRALNEFLESIDSTKRVMFVKRYWYGESVADIAAELSLSESNVATTLFRLRASLKDFLEKEEIAV